MKGAESSEWHVGTTPGKQRLQPSFGLFQAHQADSLRCLAGSKHGTLHGKNPVVAWWPAVQSPTSCTTGFTENSTNRRQMTEKGRGGGAENDQVSSWNVFFQGDTEIALRRVLELHINGNVNTPNTPSHACKLASPLSLPWCSLNLVLTRAIPFSKISVSSLIQLWNQSCVRSFSPLLLETKLLLSSCERNMQFSCLFKNKTELKSKNCFFFPSRGNYVKIYKKAKLATWNPRMVLMCWPRKINCKVLWGLLKTYKNNWWAVLIRLGCYFPPFKNDNIHNPTKHNINVFILTARDAAFRSLLVPNGWANTQLAFISSGADRQRH